MTVHAIVAWLVANCAGNLIASAITTAAGVAWHHRRIKAHHAAELKQVKEQHTEDIRQLRVHVLGAISEQRQDGGIR
jgi:hypothetical protein